MLSILTGLMLAVTPPDSDYTAYETERLEETRKVYSFTLPAVKPLDAAPSNYSTYTPSHTGPVGATELDEPPKVRLLMNRHISINAETEELEGYRVQVYAGGSMETASSIRSEVIKVFPEWEVYQLWSAPHFRVRIGDYVSRPDAMRDLNRIKAKFPGAYIVPDKVKTPKKIKHNTLTPGDLVPHEDSIPSHD